MGKIAVRRKPSKEAEGGALVARESVLHPMQRFRHEMDHLFDSFFGRSLARPVGSSLFDFDVEPFRGLARGITVLSPRIDVSESKKAYSIEAELPGMEEKDVELTLGDGLLTLKGEKKEEREEKEKDYYLSERSYGSFQRSFRVPDGVERDKVTADFKKGVLTVTLPKGKAAQKGPKTIEIKSS